MHSIPAITRLLGCLLLAAAGTVTAQAAARDTIRVLVGFPAGGAVDIVARAFADQLRQSSGTTVVVENRPGAGGMIAIDSMLAAPASGQIVEVIPSSQITLAPLVTKAIKYDPLTDLVALGSLAEFGFGIATGPATKETTMAGYKDWANAHPDKSNFGFPGVGTPQQFIGVELGKQLHISYTPIAYKGGANSVIDVIGGQIATLVTTEQLLIPYQKQGKLHTLLITSKERNPMLPGVPTAIEVGLPDLDERGWVGLFIKSGTPAKLVTQWRAAVEKVVSNPKYAATMRNLGYGVPAKQPEDFAKKLASERATWQKRVKASGFVATN
ncbi:tripartite tricarboxylate transporter substrate-binding protein [Candidimonas nitroreducens]|uniref:ABC transporter substrate-binding protein n=1 Tax=Candidimonas nitroreducens TaxID=683354 RepID=A0A225M3U5_9BURK|nr:tripartite tricarboxylate transporter substrate-binding protein [Candidimonas nitroreducens]OWT54211.1 hypothetical protein CEY11_22870 [Candidimonas nitroreducens]